MRMYAVYQKSEALRFLSHLDIQRTMQRAFRRAGIPLQYSEGFNPHPRMSFAAAAATGTASLGEWFEVSLGCEMTAEEFLRRSNPCFPEGLKLLFAAPVPEQTGKLTALIAAADYEAELCSEALPCVSEVQKALEKLLSGEIIAEKKTKGGIRPVDLRPQVMNAEVFEGQNGACMLRLRGRLTVDGGLRPELFCGALFSAMGIEDGVCRVLRTGMYFEPQTEESPLPRLARP